MYESIRGTLLSKDPGAAVIEAGGIGYRIFITTAGYDALPASGAEARLLLYHTINAEQGEQKLFGFCEARERLVFTQLMEVQRIGPATALRILSNAGVDQLIAAIAGGDVATLKRIKGVGAKVAERLVVELQEPLSKLGLLKTLPQGAPGSGTAPVSVPANQAERDAIAALVNLGYKPTQAEKAVSEAVKSAADPSNVSGLIRAALQRV